MIEKGKLYQYLTKLRKEKNCPFKIDLDEDNYYDEYLQESSTYLLFKIGENSYKVGWWNRIEDAEDWAQAESFNGDIYEKNGRYVYESEIINDVTNYLQIERENKLNSILND